MYVCMYVRVCIRIRVIYLERRTRKSWSARAWTRDRMSRRKDQDGNEKREREREREREKEGATEEKVKGR